MAQKGLDNNNNTIVNVSTPANSSDAATKGYVDSSASSTLASANSYTDGKVSALVNAAPAALDTLNELATALGNDASFSTTITNSLAGKASNSVTVTGTGALSGGGALTGNQTITHTNSGVTAGTYNNVTVNAFGHVTAGSNTSYLTGNQNISVTGDATGSGATGIALTLANSGVTAGTYTKITVDAKGRATAGAAATTSDIAEGTNLYYTAARASAAAPVQSVAGRTGAVTLAVADISGAASTTYVDTAVSNLVNAAPAALDTLKELATALGNDANFSTTVTNSIATKLSLSGGSLTGAVSSSSTLATTGGDFALANTTSSSAASTWHNRTGVKNASADKAVFLGTYGSVAVAGAHNNALNAWADLYVNNVDGSNGGAVRLPSTTYIAGSQAIHAGNYNSYAPTLTGSGASGTWGINITGNAATATSASSASTASQVTVNYNNDSNSTYQMLWGSGNSVYGTGGIYCNPSSDYLYAGSFSTGNWFRSTGATGWYNESYAVGIYATEAGNVRTYNNASFIANNVTATGVMSSASGYQTTAYVSNSRNRIWSFANSDAYGLSYFQGTAGRGGSDSIGFHFGTATDAASQFVMQSNGTFIATGELTAYSDAKVKTNVKTIENALDIVTKMRGVTFDRIQDGKASVGVIAQEVKEVLPQVVNYDEQADIHSVAYGNIVGVLIEAIKAQQVQIAELSAEVAKLKK